MKWFQLPCSWLCCWHICNCAFTNCGNQTLQSPHSGVHLAKSTQRFAFRRLYTSYVARIFSSWSLYRSMVPSTDHYHNWGHYVLEYNEDHFILLLLWPWVSSSPIVIGKNIAILKILIKFIKTLPISKSLHCRYETYYWIEAFFSPRLQSLSAPPK